MLFYTGHKSQKSTFDNCGFQSVANAVRHINEYHKMPDNDVWPPKPDLPDPLTEYDDVIAAKIAALPEAGRSRLLLIMALRVDKGMDLRQAYAVVNNYCDRHDVFARTKTSRLLAWLGCLPILAWLCFAGFLFYWMKRRDEILSQPHHHAALLALSEQALMVISFAVVLAFVNLGIQLVRLQRRRKK